MGVQLSIVESEMSGVLVSDLVSVSHGNTTHTIFIKITNTIELNNTIFVKSIIIRIVRLPSPQTCLHTNQMKYSDELEKSMFV